MKKALTRLLATVLVIVVGLGSAFALDVPPLIGRIVDNAKVLRAEQVQELTRTLSALEEKTTAQVVILTVESLQGDTPEDFVQKVFQSWKLGVAEKNNGLLIFVAKEERKFRIQPGYGLEGVIPDAEAWSIIRREMAPHMKGKKGGDDDYFAALTASVSRISALISEEVQPRERSLNGGKGNEGALLLYLVLVVIAAFATFVTDSMVAGGIIGAVGSPIVTGLLFGVTLPNLGLALVAGFIIGSLSWFIVQLGLNFGLGGGNGGFSGGGGLSGGGGATGDF